MVDWSIEGFSGSTPRGIYIGSMVQDVEKAYPSLRFVLNKTQLFGKTADKKYNIDFIISNGVVIRITIFNENP